MTRRAALVEMLERVECRCPLNIAPTPEESLLYYAIRCETACTHTFIEERESGRFCAGCGVEVGR